MRGVTISFHAEQAVSRRLLEIAEEEGVTVSRLLRQLLVPGLLLPPVGRRMLRRILSEGGPEAAAELRDQLTRALSTVSNKVAERRMLADAAMRHPNGPAMTEQEIDAAAAAAVEKYQRQIDDTSRGPSL